MTERGVEKKMKYMSVVKKTLLEEGEEGER